MPNSTAKLARTEIQIENLKETQGRLVDAQVRQDERLNEFALGMEKLSNRVNLDLQVHKAGIKANTEAIAEHRTPSGRERWSLWGLVVTEMCAIVYLIISKVL